jgi:hypothetical protein
VVGWRGDDGRIETIRVHVPLPLRERLLLLRLRVRLRLYRLRIWLRHGRPALDLLDRHDRTADLVILYGLCPHCRGPREPVMNYSDGELRYDLRCLRKCPADPPPGIVDQLSRPVSRDHTLYDLREDGS